MFFCKEFKNIILLFKFIFFKQNTITNRSILEQKIQQMFAQAHVCLHTFNYPGDFIALIEETDFEKQNVFYRPVCGCTDLVPAPGSEDW